MRLTTARYYTPSGRSIQARGIEPDIEVEPSKVEAIQQRPGRIPRGKPAPLDQQPGLPADKKDEKKDDKPAASATTPAGSRCRRPAADRAGSCRAARGSTPAVGRSRRAAGAGHQ